MERRILIVDDHAPTRKTIRAMLEADKENPATIVEAGLAGAAAAVVLARSGFRIEICQHRHVAFRLGQQRQRRGVHERLDEMPRCAYAVHSATSRAYGSGSP